MAKFFEYLNGILARFREISRARRAFSKSQSDAVSLGRSRDGDPEATTEAILKFVDAENPPLRLGLGTSILPRARAAYSERLETWEAWEDVSNAAMGEPQESMAAWIEKLAPGTLD